MKHIIITVVEFLAGYGFEVTGFNLKLNEEGKVDSCIGVMDSAGNGVSISEIQAAWSTLTRVDYRLRDTVLTLNMFSFTITNKFL